MAEILNAKMQEVVNAVSDKLALSPEEQKFLVQLLSEKIDGKDAYDRMIETRNVVVACPVLLQYAQQRAKDLGYEDGTSLYVDRVLDAMGRIKFYGLKRVAIKKLFS